MPHMVSLIITYTAIGVAFILIMRLEKKCTTTHQEDSPVKTEPSPTGQTPTTSPQQYSGHFNPHELQDDTEFRSQYKGGLMPLHQPVSAFYSAPSMDGGHNDE